MNPLDLQDAARLPYAQILLRQPRTRNRLLYVWQHPDYPHRKRFQEQRSAVVGLLEHDDPTAYAANSGGSWSLRSLTSEIPAVIWSLWDESQFRANVAASKP